MIETKKKVVGDPLLPLIKESTPLPNSPFHSVRRKTAFALLGQFSAALQDSSLAERTKRLRDHLAAWPDTPLANELVATYNKLIDEARATGSEHPLLSSDVKAQEQASGYAGTSGADVQAVLHAVHEALVEK